MSERPSSIVEDPAPGLDGDQGPPILTVSEISALLKSAVEDAFPQVRVRGEISGFKRAASGHLYFTLKDEDAVLDGVCWRGTAGRLGLAPEDGMEVVATGRLTTYHARSRYQIVIDAMELAGEGALLKLLEERRKKLAAEGLFDLENKQDIPFLPGVIGVITSPTGAVIRDPHHRLAQHLGVTVTPEAAIVAAGGKMVYRGRIDNLYGDLGRKRPLGATRHELRNALDAVLAGKEIQVKRTEAIGCYLPK